MTIRFAITAFGTPVEVMVSGAAAAEARDAAQAAWGALFSAAVPTSGLAGEVNFTVDQPERLPHFLDSLSSRVTIAGIEALSGEHLMLHAAGLARGGISVACVGPSGTGKTTLAHAAAGVFEYVSDETVTITEAGEVLAYPKPLSIKVESGPKEQHNPLALDLTLAPARTQFGGVVILNRTGGSELAHLEPLTLSEAMTALVPEASYLGRLDRPLTWLARALVGATRLTYSSAADAVALLAEAHPAFTEDRVAPMSYDGLEDSTLELDSWRSVVARLRDGWSSAAGAGSAGGGEVYEHGESLHELLIDHDAGHVLAFMAQTFRAVSPVAAAILIACEGGATREQIVLCCESIFSPAPAGSTQIVSDAIDTLVDEGVLTPRNQDS